MISKFALLFSVLGFALSMKGPVTMQGNCDKTECECPLAWKDLQNPNPPPSCVDASTALFTFTGTKSGGCCYQPGTNGCNLQPCRFKVSVSIKANAGQTCDFRIVPPAGDGSTEVCTASADCAFASSTTQQLNCGHSQTYQIKVNGTVIWKRTVECGNCEAAAN